MITHAVLGTDLSKASDKLIENAFELKKLGVKKISLINVYKTIVDVADLEEIEIRGLGLPQKSEEKMKEQKQSLEKQGFVVDHHFFFGNPAVILKEIVADLKADILVIGSHGYSYSDPIIGSTAYELLNNVKSPTLMIILSKYKDKDGKEKWEMLKRNITNHVFLPTDFSDFAEEAFQFTKNIKNEISELTLMHVQDEVNIKEYAENRLAEFNKIDSARLNRLKKDFASKHPETKINIVIEYGKPKEIIINYTNADRDNPVSMIVMGNQGRGFLSKLFLGSVSHYIARHSDANVTLIPLKP